MVEFSLGDHFADYGRGACAQRERTEAIEWIQPHPSLPVRAFVRPGSRAALEPAVARREVPRVVEQIRRVTDAEIRWLIVEPPEQPSVLRALDREGFKWLVDCPGMVLHFSRFRPAAGPQDFRVARVSSEQEAEKFGEIYARANGHHGATRRAFVEALVSSWHERGDRYDFALGYSRSTPCCCMKTRYECFDETGVSAVGVYQVATDPQFRRRGYAKALVTAELERARSWGADCAVLQSEPEVASLYGALGFRQTSRLIVYSRSG